MRPALKMGAALAAILFLSSAAVAAKPGKTPDKTAANETLPPGIEKALSKVLKAAGLGHGPDKPEGKGKGYGHRLHDHDRPVSP